MHTTATSTQNRAHYLRTLPAIRERSTRVFNLASQDKLQFFTYKPENEHVVAAFCSDIITRHFSSNFDQIPPHGRWRHLDAGLPRITPLIESWAASNSPPDQKESCKRLIDLFFVSVLLDAGAGNSWQYHDPQSGTLFSRSEGLAVASFNMFHRGFFSSNPDQPYRVDAAALSRITVDQMAAAFQVTESNKIVGIDGRTTLLYNLAAALNANPTFFGHDARPGNIIDFLEQESISDGSSRIVPVAVLWHVLIEGLSPIWPSSRISLAGVPLGDVWPCPALSSASASPIPGDDLVPFHKLTSWITYSLIEPIEKLLLWKFSGTEDLTGLPEYRNGGLFLDLGVLTLKPGSLPIDPISGIPRVPPSHPAIVEWRAMTVILIDRIADAIRKNLALSADRLSLAQILESATWKAGREIAKQLRPETGGPPIEIDSDGTVF